MHAYHPSRCTPAVVVLCGLFLPVVFSTSPVAASNIFLLWMNWGKCLLSVFVLKLAFPSRRRDSLCPSTALHSHLCERAEGKERGTDACKIFPNMYRNSCSGREKKLLPAETGWAFNIPAAMK